MTARAHFLVTLAHAAGAPPDAVSIAARAAGPVAEVLDVIEELGPEDEIVDRPFNFQGDVRDYAVTFSAEDVRRLRDRLVDQAARALARVLQIDAELARARADAARKEQP